MYFAEVKISQNNTLQKLTCPSSGLETCFEAYSHRMNRYVSLSFLSLTLYHNQVLAGVCAPGDHAVDQLSFWKTSYSGSQPALLFWSSLVASAPGQTSKVTGRGGQLDPSSCLFPPALRAHLIWYAGPVLHQQRWQYRTKISDGVSRPAKLSC